MFHVWVWPLCLYPCGQAPAVGRVGMNLYYHEACFKQGASWGNPKGQSQQSRDVFDLRGSPPSCREAWVGRGAASVPAEVGRAPVQGRDSQPPGSSFTRDRCGMWPCQGPCAWLQALARLVLGAAVYRSCLESQLPAVGPWGPLEIRGPWDFPAREGPSPARSRLGATSPVGHFSTNDRSSNPG